MDIATVMAAFDDQLRRNPPAEPGTTVEPDPQVTRVVGPTDSWRGVSWSDLCQGDTSSVINDQIQRLAPYGEWEWKFYSYDRPADLPEKLLAAGFVRDAEETVMVAALDEMDLTVGPPPGVELTPVVDARGVEALVAVHDAVFGGTHESIGRAVLAGIHTEPARLAAVLAVAKDVPICAGRVDFPDRGDFASLWGGGTVAQWRGRGVFRALVAYRAALAAARGYRYVHVDASAASRPILEQLGFTTLATTTPYRMTGA